MFSYHLVVKVILADGKRIRYLSSMKLLLVGMFAVGTVLAQLTPDEQAAQDALAVSTLPDTNATETAMGGGLVALMAYIMMLHRKLHKVTASDAAHSKTPQPAA